MRNIELFNKLNKLCEKYGFMEVKYNLQSLGCREFEDENKLSEGERLSEVIDELVNLHKLKRKHLFENFQWDKRDYEWEDRFNETEEYYTNEIKENQKKVLDVIMG